MLLLLLLDCFDCFGWVLGFYCRPSCLNVVFFGGCLFSFSWSWHFGILSLIEDDSCYASGWFCLWFDRLSLPPCPEDSSAFFPLDLTVSSAIFERLDPSVMTFAVFLKLLSPGSLTLASIGPTGSDATLTNPPTVAPMPYLTNVVGVLPTPGYPLAS